MPIPRPMYVCLYTYLNVYIDVECMHTHTYMHSNIHVYLPMYTHRYIHMCNMCIYVPKYAYMPIHGCLHTCMQICIYIQFKHSIHMSRKQTGFLYIEHVAVMQVCPYKLFLVGLGLAKCGLCIHHMASVCVPDATGHSF